MNYLDNEIVGMDIVTGEIIEQNPPFSIGKLKGKIRMWVTNEAFMRAIDYRTKDDESEIVLVIMKSFNSNRAEQ